jgi:hypothetical protein
MQRFWFNKTIEGGCYTVKSLRVGLVDLDTSHPANFIPIIRSLGHEVVALFDGGAVYPEGYAQSFARDHGIPTVYESLGEMAAEVDLAFIHSCNWDIHVERARPFIEAGKAVFIDKPLAGNIRDLRQMIAWSEQGALITGGSALRYCYELENWISHNNASEEWVYALAGCSVDEYNYGIHAYTLMHGLMGTGIEQARHLGTNGAGQHQVELSWRDGRQAVISVGTSAGYLPFYATIVTQRKVEHIDVDNSRLYQALLERVLPYFAGETSAPISLEEMAEVEMAAIAAKLSREQGGGIVKLKEIPEHYSGYDGAAFAQHYKKLRVPQTS